MASIIQLSIDFDSLKTSKKGKAPKAKANPKFINCPSCNHQIDLSSPLVKEVKCCHNCGDRTWLLNLKTAQACILYAINPEILGGRLRDE